MLKRVKTWIRVVLFFLLIVLVALPFMPFWLLFFAAFYSGKSKSKLQFWGYNNLIALDQWFNAMFAPLLNRLLQPLELFRFGYVDETVSSVIGKNLTAAEHFVIIDNILSIVMFDPNHSYDARELDEGGDGIEDVLKQKAED